MSGGRLFIERPWTDWEALRRCVTPAEWKQACSFGSERRRREFLTWRAVVRRELGPDVHIAYNAAGAPVVSVPGATVVSGASDVAGPAWQIGVSHCDGYVAVCLSRRRCAVDIERLDRNFGRIASRYLTDCERSLLAEPWWLAVAWCAKETLYKYSGRRELELLCDLQIVQADPHTCRLVGHIAGSEPVELTWQLLANAAVVFVL